MVQHGVGVGALAWCGRRVWSTSASSAASFGCWCLWQESVQKQTFTWRTSAAGLCCGTVSQGQRVHGGCVRGIVCARGGPGGALERRRGEWGEGRGCSSPEGSDLRVERHAVGSDSCPIRQRSPRKAGCRIRQLSDRMAQLNCAATRHAAACLPASPPGLVYGCSVCAPCLRTQRRAGGGGGSVWSERELVGCMGWLGTWRWLMLGRMVSDGRAYASQGTKSSVQAWQAGPR